MIYIRRSQNEQVHYTLLRSLYHKAKNDAKNSGVQIYLDTAALTSPQLRLLLHFLWHISMTSALKYSIAASVQEVLFEELRKAACTCIFVSSGVIFADCVFVRLSPFFYILV